MIGMTESLHDLDGGDIAHLALKLAATVVVAPKNQLHHVVDQMDVLSQLTQEDVVHVMDNAEQVGDTTRLIAAQTLILSRRLHTIPARDVGEVGYGEIGIDGRSAILARKVLSMRITSGPSGMETHRLARKIAYVLWDLAVLPPELAQRAVIVLGEAAFSPPDALLAFRSLEEQRYAVYGVERWVRDDSVGEEVEWMGTSDYESECNRTSTDWPTYVRCCLQGATSFVEWGAGTQDAVFSYTWGWEGEREDRATMLRPSHSI